MVALPQDWRPRLLYGVLGALVLLSLVPLVEAVGWWALLGLLAIPLAFLVARLSRYGCAFVEVIGAIVVPWLCLVAFNQILHWMLRLWERLFDAQPQPRLVPGLILACVVFALAAWGYLVLWRERKWAAPIVAVVLAIANMVGVPLLLAAPKHETAVAVSHRVVSQLEVSIVVPGGEPASMREGEPTRGLPNWDVRYSVARAGAGAVDWLLVDSTDAQAALAAARGAGPPLSVAPAPREGADRFVLLNVDGVPPVIRDPRGLESVPRKRGEVRRWLRIARAAAPGAGVAVLLRSTDPKRLAVWRRGLKRGRGTVASVQEQGFRTLTDAALVLAGQAPGTSEDLALATRYRPVLLFNGNAKRDTPLDIDAFLASGRVELCHDDQLEGSRCETVRRAADLVSGSTHLKIDKRDTSEADPPSAIYVHPTHSKGLLRLDYWWYLDDNPARVGGGTSCGVGLSLPGKTCFDHDSDWEGMTVVLRGAGENAVPVAIQYAEHSDVVRYEYAQLVDNWREQAASNGAWQSRTFRQNLARIDDLDRRPLAFIATGSHAAYPSVCKGNCHQVAVRSRKENPRNGLKSWPGNDTAHCILTGCLRLIPTRNRGHDPALWNAYEGVWGDRHCILHGAYCSAEVSPGSPGTQKRYKDPLRVTGYVDARWKFHSCGGDGPACPPLPGGPGQ
ncbi:MAG TPA: hypothetical protein VF072_05110 [Thermoleophilaceae bacterium]